ncbi:MAG: hypothetical protein RJA44_959, partial [Pseudomonadota bacterium]
MSVTTTTAAASAAPASAQPVMERLRQRWQAERESATAPTQAQLREWLLRRSGMPWAQLADWPSSAADSQLISFADGQRRLCLALRDDTRGLVIVLADPFDASTRLWIEARLRAAGHPRTHWHVGDAEEIQAFYGRLERDTRALDAQRSEFEGSGEGEEAEALNLSLAD